MMSGVARFDMAALEALCVDNAEPSVGDINQAKAALPAIMEDVAEALYRYPVNPDKYAREQLAFRVINRIMEQAGWRHCGAGFYSSTYFKGGLAIKVGFKPQDTALLYATWCRANQGKAGVPVIHKMLARGFGYTVLMDRLEAIAGELTPDDPLYDPQLAAEFDSVRTTFEEGVDGWGAHPDLCRTAIAIREFFEDVAHRDLTRNNVMLDRSGNLVITDPVSFVGDTASGYYDEGAEYAGRELAAVRFMQAA